MTRSAMSNYANTAINAYATGILTLEEARAVIGSELDVALDVDEQGDGSGKIGDTPVVAYEAFSEETRPVCLYVGDGDKSVTVYWGDEGIEGVALYSSESDTVIGTLGEVPSA